METAKARATINKQVQSRNEENWLQCRRKNMSSNSARSKKLYALPAARSVAASRYGKQTSRGSASICTCVHMQWERVFLFNFHPLPLHSQLSFLPSRMLLFLVLSLSLAPLTRDPPQPFPKPAPHPLRPPCCKSRVSLCGREEPLRQTKLGSN